MELHHVDANANLTTAERFRRAGARAHLRLESLGVVAPLTLGDGDSYTTQFAIGSPPQEVRAVVDTTSSLVWTQCMTCRPNCFEQDLDIYDFSLSSTGMAVYCNDSLCTAEYGAGRCRGHHAGACAIRTTTYDMDIAGVLRIEEFTFGSDKANLAFGCVTKTNNVVAGLDGASGVISLGKGPMSLVSQIGGNRFSYCLNRYFTDQVQSSPLFVGPSAGLNGDAPFASAPFGRNQEPFSDFYNLHLATISVGEADLNIPSDAFFYGGVIIDVSSPFMFLVDVAYRELMQEMSRRLGSSLVPSPVDWLELCVALADVSWLVPPLVLHFGEGGGAWTIPAENYWAPAGNETSCMVVVNSAHSGPPFNGTSIIGNYMQQNVHVLYDLDNHEISFQPEDCSSI
ncbi:hypothetical protein ACQ4PT_012904 [Festuca glaucescens]